MLTLLIGLVAGAAFTCFAGARRSASAERRFRHATFARDASVQVSGADDAVALVASILGLPGVRAGAPVSGYAAFSARGDFDLGILAPLDGRFGTVLDRARVLDGRMPRPDRADEVAVNARARSQLRARVGDTITLATLTPQQIAVIEQTYSGRPEGPALRLHVTGVFRIADDLSGDVASATILATPAFERTYGPRVGRFGHLVGVRLAGGPRAVPAFEEQVRNMAGDRDASVTSAADAEKDVTDAARLLGIALALMGLVVAVASIVAGGQALNRQLWTAAPDQAVLASLGMTPRQRIAGNILVIAPVAAGAAVIAAAAAYGASPLMPINIARQAEPHPGLAFDTVVLLGGAALVTLFVLLGAGLAAWRLAVVALRADQLDARPSRATALAARLRPGPTAGVGVNLALEPGRGRDAVPVRPAIVAAAFGIAGVVAAFTFGANLDRLVATPARYGANFDLMPDLAGRDAERAVAMKEVGDAGVVHVSPVRIGGRSADGYSIAVFKGHPDFTVLSGRTPSSNGEVALGPDQFRRLRVNVGDRVAIDAKEGPKRFRVVGKVLLPGLGDNPATAGVVLTPDDHRLVAQSDGSDQSVLDWAPGVDSARGERRFGEVFPDALSAYSRPRPPNSVANLHRVDVVPRVLGGLLALIGLAATGHAIVTAVRRRRRDFAVLRVVGFVRGQVTRTVAWQATTLAVIGVALGVPLGLVAGRLTWSLVANAVAVGNDAFVPGFVFLVVPGALIAANLAAALPGMAAGRVPPAAVLRAE